MRLYLIPLVVCICFSLSFVIAVERSDSQNRLGVPDAAAIQSASGVIHDLFAKEISQARKPSQLSAISKSLAQRAADTNDDAAGKYVLLTQSRDLAIRAGDPEAAVAAATSIGDAFDVDALQVKAEALNACSRNVRADESMDALCRCVKTLLDEVLAADRYEIARQLSQSCLAAVRRSGDATLIADASACDARIAQAATAWSEARNALAALKTDPTDARANVTVGRFYCFSKEDWKTGLPLLARGNDPKMRDLAKSEIAAGQDGKALLHAADGWWNEADRNKGPAAAAMKAHAHLLYSAALPNLSGLEAVMVKKKLEDADHQADSIGHSANISAAGTWVDSSFELKVGHFYEITATGAWQGSAGPRCGPAGFCPPNTFSRLGPQPWFNGDLAQAAYLGQHPRSSLIAKIETKDWSFYVGDQVRLLAPFDGKLMFRMNDTDDPSEARHGTIHASFREIDPPKLKDGLISVSARIDAEDFLHITPEGLSWEYGGSWGRVGEHGGYYPTIVNGIDWWLQWPTQKQSTLYASRDFWPGNAGRIKVVATRALRGGIRIANRTASDVSIGFSDSGLGSSEVSCVVSIR